MSLEDHLLSMLRSTPVYTVEYAGQIIFLKAVLEEFCDDDYQTPHL